MFINLGDKYVADNRGSGTDVKRGAAKYAPAGPPGYVGRDMARHKSLLGLPWRYALACTDQLGLILRAEIIWAKPNGLPESVTDRVRRAHEQVFHLVKQPRYYSAVDEIREPHAALPKVRGIGGYDGANGQQRHGFTSDQNPLGKLPGSVWSIPSAPLVVPPELGVDHFAAFPPALVRPLVLGWSPPGICAECGEGRRPISSVGAIHQRRPRPDGWLTAITKAHGADGREGRRVESVATITGYACACPTPDAPTRPAVVLDPFAGTGTTLLVASAYGRTGVGTDLSRDYCRLAAWRTRDPGERARARDLPKPPPVPDGQAALFDMEAM
jgi:hypothetical protein